MVGISLREDVKDKFSPVAGEVMRRDGYFAHYIYGYVAGSSVPELQRTLEPFWGSQRIVGNPAPREQETGLFQLVATREAFAAIAALPTVRKITLTPLPDGNDGSVTIEDVKSPYLHHSGTTMAVVQQPVIDAILEYQKRTNRSSVTARL